VRALVGRLARLIGLLLLTCFGTVGFRAIEGWSWGDALYMTVITLSTVGFQEAHPLSESGKLFTVALILAGSGVAIYLLTLTAQLILDGRLSRAYLKERMTMRIRTKHDHVVVVGYGRFGQAVVEELRDAGIQVVVLDSDPELAPLLESQGMAYVIASGSSDEGLVEAGVEGASAVVAATPSDADNVFITLAAKELNPEIRVHARCESSTAARRLTRAGADQVVSPFQMGGSRTAASILRPAVVDFLEILSPRGEPAVEIEQIVVATGSPLTGSELREVERDFPSLRIVALRHDDEAIGIAPPPDTRIQARDLLVVIGDHSPLLELAGRAEPPEE
jgi:voltage-gated potassium channel